MEETFEQKVIRNVQNKFAVYKTTEVVGIKSGVPNLEWMESDDVDKFFSFASNLGARVIYITEADEEDEEGNSKNTIIQVGFIYQGIMHHINLIEEEDEDNEDEEDDEYEYVDEEDEERVLYDKNQEQEQPRQQTFNQSESQSQQQTFNQNKQPPSQSQQPQNNNQGSDFIGNF